MNDRLDDPGILIRFWSSVRGRLTPLLFTGSSTLTAMTQLVSGFLVIKWILPEELGLWTSIRLAQVYAFLLLAGVNNGLSRELPFFLGRGDQSFADRLAASALFCSTVGGMVVFLGGIGCAVGFAEKGPQVVWAILAVTVTIVSSFYQNFLLVTFRSNDSFNKLSWIKLAEAGMSFATIPLVYFFHYNGMLARAVVLQGLCFWLMHVLRPMRLKMRLDREAMKLLLKTGVPIFGLDYMKNLTGTLDRVVLLKVGGVKDVGYYSLASMAVAALQVLPQSLSAYVYPRMTFKFGENGDARALWKYGLKFSILAVGITGLAAICGVLILPRLLPAFAPQYLGGLRAAEILLIASALEGATIISNALWSMKSWKLMTAYQVSSSALFALGPILGVIIAGPSIESVAWGGGAAYLCRAFLALGFAYYGTHTLASNESPSPSSLKP